MTADVNDAWVVFVSLMKSFVINTMGGGSTARS
jgi:hypothetical protein